VAGTITDSAWLRTLRSEAVVRHHLLCFPPGGGSATAYRDLAQRFGPGVAVFAVQYPGRQDRLGEDPITDLVALADRIAREVLAQGRVAGLSLFGHSMGATVAFETARRLERAGQPVTTLFVSGRPAPTFEETGRLHLASDDDLIGDLVRLAADPAPLEMLRAEPSRDLSLSAGGAAARGHRGAGEHRGPDDATRTGRRMADTHRRRIRPRDLPRRAFLSGRARRGGSRLRRAPLGVRLRTEGTIGAVPTVGRPERTARVASTGSRSRTPPRGQPPISAPIRARVRDRSRR
jgi:thioesterase domain-containing protein